jgi:hypothetical protein
MSFIVIAHPTYLPIYGEHDGKASGYTTWQVTQRLRAETRRIKSSRQGGRRCECVQRSKHT